MKITGYGSTRSAGFTLVELMIALTLSLFLLGGAILLSSAGSSAASQSDMMARTQENLRFLSNFFVQELRMTGSFPVIDEATIPDDFFVITDTSSVTTKYESLENCLGQSTISNTPQGVAVNTYSLNGNRLQCDGNQGQPAETMISGLETLRFEPITTGTPAVVIGVKVTVELEDEPFDNVPYTLNVGFRNPIIRQSL